MTESVIGGEKNSEEGMRKKILFWLVATILLTTALLVEAQQPTKIARIGFLGYAPAHNIDALRQGLRELGWVEGQNITIDYKQIEVGRNDQLPGFAADLVRLKVDVIVTTSTEPGLAAQKATKTIPIVMAGGSDPVGSGLIASLARPGGNITGVRSLLEIGGKRLELLKETFPKASRVAVLWRPEGRGNAPQLEEFETAAHSLRVQLLPVGAKGPNDYANAFSTMRRERANALITVQSPALNIYRTKIVELAASHRLPAIYSQSEFAEAGGLMAYGSSSTEQYRRAAVYVDKILKGAKAADLPVEQPMKFELVINLKAAKKIGLTIPPNVLARADKVIK